MTPPYLRRRPRMVASYTEFALFLLAGIALGAGLIATFNVLVTYL